MRNLDLTLYRTAYDGAVYTPETVLLVPPGEGGYFDVILKTTCWADVADVADTLTIVSGGVSQQPAYGSFVRVGDAVGYAGTMGFMFSVSTGIVSSSGWLRARIEVLPENRLEVSLTHPVDYAGVLGTYSCRLDLLVLPVK